MLPNVGRHVGVALGQFPDGFDHRLGLNLFALIVILQAVTCAPLFNLLPPVANVIQRLGDAFLIQQLQHLIEHQTCVTDDRNIRRYRFGDRRRIDINVQYSGIRAVLREVIGGAIVKAHPNGEDHVRMMHGHVGFIGTVHPQHT